MSSVGLVNFISAFGKLKRIFRTGWLTRGVSKVDVESVAEHVLRTTLISMVVADFLKSRGIQVNSSLVLKMGLLHDLSEVVLKDIDKEAWICITPNQKLKHKTENKAFMEASGSLPAEIQKDYKKIWKKYVKEDSIEAKIVKMADKMEMIFQAFEYITFGYNPKLLGDLLKEAEEDINRSGLPIAVEILKELKSRF